MPRTTSFVNNYAEAMRSTFDTHAERLVSFIQENPGADLETVQAKAASGIFMGGVRTDELRPFVESVYRQVKVEGITPKDQG